MPVLALDLDGTICFGGGAVAPQILAVLKMLPQDIRVIIASARHPINVAQAVPPELLKSWDVVGANGALALQRGTLVYQSRLDPDAASRVLKALDAMNCAYLAYGVDFVLPGRHPHAMHRVIRHDIGRHLRLGDAHDVPALIKILVLPQPKDKSPVQVCMSEPVFCVMSHADGTFDVMAKGTDKTGGIVALGHTLPLDAAFGNDANDVQMLRMARHSVAVGDHPSICLLADQIVPPGHDHQKRIASVLQTVLHRIVDQHVGVQA
ncbi:HAD hydrolase family protein [Puniceibacterium sediminis]|uniref:Hydroxymethylpyrimidine pyrophosphatase n=1 Tax=Puniceibacterium sediminis TaxID=1608407 RepID=A0A238ZVG4_9RHOB|nr:HAD family hydrolase [Puniceibacterium sediminis]SNR86653.1 hypothetical protein SAMN06265370_14111 [Puniceibacterium sediminis]